jgi:Flp pilus assembly protein TadB
MPDGEFEGYTKARLTDITSRLERIEKKIDTQNGRIRKLEIWRGYTIGIVSVVMLIASLWLKYG